MTQGCEWHVTIRGLVGLGAYRGNKGYSMMSHGNLSGLAKSGIPGYTVGVHYSTSLHHRYTGKPVRLTGSLRCAS